MDTFADLVTHKAEAELSRLVAEEQSLRIHRDEIDRALEINGTEQAHVRQRIADYRAGEVRQAQG